MHPTDQAFIAAYLAQSSSALHAFEQSPQQAEVLAAMAGAVVAAMRAGGKLLVAGNGGSAGDAQHIAAEFTGRMLYDRPPLAAVALHTDTSALTAIANDYGFATVFERQVRALGRPGDVFLGLSTSGRSENILLAMQAARKTGMSTLGFTGESGGGMAEHTDILLRAPATLAPVVQQIHITAGHVLAALVERAVHPRSE